MDAAAILGIAFSSDNSQSQKRLMVNIKDQIN